MCLPMPYNRRSMVLLEVMVSMALALGLLSTALYFYRYTALAEMEMKKKEEVSFQRRLIQSRLSSHLFRIEDPLFFTVEEESGLTLGPSLIFTGYSEARNQFFHGPVLMRLLVDPQERLVLAVWQDNRLKDPSSPPPMHPEVLLEGVSGLEFEFLVGESSPHPFGEKGGYVVDWPHSNDSPQPRPRAIKIGVKTSGSSERDPSFQWAFPLPES